MTFIYCATKKSRKRVQDARFKQNLKTYIDKAKGTEQRVINLEDVPDPSMTPMMEHQNSKADESDIESNHADDDTLSGSVPTIDVQNFSNTSKTLDSLDMPKIDAQKSSTLAKSTGFMHEQSQQRSTTVKSSSTTMMYYESGMIRSTFKPQESNLALRRQQQPQAPLRLDAPNTLPRPGGDILRLGGITQFPVMSPPPAGFEADPPIPGRKTSFINYMNPKEL